jgi:hypothetical protein
MSRKHSRRVREKAWESHVHNCNSQQRTHANTTMTDSNDKITFETDSAHGLLGYVRTMAKDNNIEVSDIELTYEMEL